MPDPQDLSGLLTLARIVDPVAERFQDAGYRLYLVGGVVRDLVQAGSGDFNPSANDIDLTTDALPADVKRLLSPIAEAIWSQGERFGTIGAKVNGHDMEITTHRAEAYDPESRKPMVTFGEDLGEDLSRRDFTINAAAIELPSHELHDPYDGMNDLAAGALRTPLSPEVSFTDDPLRMMRAARFIARFSLTASPELVEAATALADRLTIVSVERIADEFERLLRVEDPAPGFEFLDHTGLLAKLVPALSDVASEADRRLAVRLGSASQDPIVRRAGVLWPIREHATEALRHLRYSRAVSASTAKLLSGAVRGLAVAERSGTASSGDDQKSKPIDPPFGRRIAAEVGPSQVDALIELVGVIATEDPSISHERAERFISLMIDLRSSEDLTDLDSPLTGAEIMEILDLEPGPEVGFAQKHLRKHRIDTGPFTAAEAREVLLSWSRQE